MQSKFSPIISGLVVVLFIFSFARIEAQNKKADLIIYTINAKKFGGASFNRSVSAPQTETDIPYIEYTISIRNIGKAPVVGPFCIYMAKGMLAIADNDYTLIEIVNEGDSKIAVGGIIHVKYISRDLRDHVTSKFLVNYDRTLNPDSSLPFIEELNYENNSYIF